MAEDFTVKLNQQLAGAEAAATELQNQVAAARAAGQSYAELERAMEKVQTRIKALSAGSQSLSQNLKERR